MSKLLSASIDEIASEVLEACWDCRQIEIFSLRHREIDIDGAYQIAAAIRRMREASGEAAVGRKIGFTNRRIWSEYDVHAPIWGYMYDRTVHNVSDVCEAFDLGGFLEPRIEPEIAFCLSCAPDPAMDEAALLDCIDWVAHAFEIVQSPYRGWLFSATDCVIGFGLHGALLLGRRRPVADAQNDWLSMLSNFEASLVRNGAIVDQGSADDVLGGPLSALSHLIGVLSRDPSNPPLVAGEVVTTGTLTRAFPIKAGETWATQLLGVTLDNLRVTFA